MKPISPVIRLNPVDDVVIARRQLIPGTILEEEGGLRIAALIPAGHKMATRAIEAGQPAIARAAVAEQLTEVRTPM
jgi:altronate hydrolase